MAIRKINSRSIQDSAIVSADVGVLISPTLVTPALGTPASGVVTNLTGTASININGTVGDTTASTGAFTSLTASTTLGVTGLSTLTAGAVVQGLTVGRGAGAVATNTAVGASALAANTTGSQNTAIGRAGIAITTGSRNTAVGYLALQATTTSVGNSAFGNGALFLNTTGELNTAIGDQALLSNTTANNNTAVGYQAGYTNQTGANFAYFGYQAGLTSTGNAGTFLGYQAGLATTTGSSNTFVGAKAGEEVTTGANNTIIGRYNGNQGGLDIRTASNYIVLSDGGGNPKFVHRHVDGSTSLPGTSGSYNSSTGTFDSTLQIGSNLQLMSFQNGTSNTQSQFGSNVYYNAGYKYISSSAGASKLFIGGEGTFEFSGAAIGTANNPITFTALLGSNGNGYTVYLQGATPNATGTGLTFPASQNASSNANTLDDYEEGSWTPVLRGSGTAGTFATSTATGKYTKVGNMVTVTCAISVASITGSPTGDLQITGLPFACIAGASSSGATQTQYVGITQVSSVSFSTRGTSSTLYLTYVNGSQVAAVVQANALSTGAIVDFCISYPT